MSANTKVDFQVISYLNAIDEKTKRAYAVSAALELIAVRISNNTSSGILAGELSKLSEYADTIQEAIKVK